MCGCERGSTTFPCARREAKGSDGAGVERVAETSNSGRGGDRISAGVECEGGCGLGRFEDNTRARMRVRRELALVYRTNKILTRAAQRFRR